VRILPFLILLLGVIVLTLKWGDIPDYWPVHWGINGQPDRWSTTTPRGVFLPVGAGFLLCCFLGTVAWLVRMSAGRRRELWGETATEIAALTTELVRSIEIGLAIVFVYIALASDVYSG